MYNECLASACPRVTCGRHVHVGQTCKDMRISSATIISPPKFGEAVKRERQIVFELKYIGGDIQSTRGVNGG